MPWDLAVPDWRERIRAGQSLLPALPDLDQAQAKRAIAIFNKLRLPDVPGTPPLAEAGGEWFREIVGALHGSVRPGHPRADDPRGVPAGAEEEFEDVLRRGAHGDDAADERAAAGGIPAHRADGLAGASSPLARRWA